MEGLVHFQLSAVSKPERKMFISSCTLDRLLTEIQCAVIWEIMEITNTGQHNISLDVLYFRYDPLPRARLTDTINT